MPSTPYKRIVLKISGESLCSAGSSGIDAASLEAAAKEIATVAGKTQIALVVGAGNLVRGKQFCSGPAGEIVKRATADQMGMLATVINALALQEALEVCGLKATVMSAIPTNGVCEPFVLRRAIELLDAGQVVLFAGGTGSPFFTTDMCAALRACEIDADVVMKATKVDGVYDRDPMKHSSAVKHDQLSYQDVLAKGLGVMDLTAITMCMENDIPILVFKLFEPGQLPRAVAGQKVGTLVSKGAL